MNIKTNYKKAITILDNIINEKDLKYDIKNSAEELLGEIEYYLNK